MSDATSTQPPPSTPIRLLLAWLVPAIAVVITMRPVAEPVLDPDVWWHLRVGQWVVEHRAVPVMDPFTQLGPTTPWVAYSWLYEVLLFGLYSAFGLAGIIAYRVVVSLLIVRAIHAFVTRIEPRYLVAISLSGAAVLALGGLFGERPWLVTILFSVITLHAIVVMRQPGVERLPLWVRTLPVLYVVWANVHIQFVYGLLLLAIACVAPWIDTRLGWTQAETAARPMSRRYRQLVGLAVLCCLATLVNPYGIRLYVVIVEYATQPGPFRFINELKALEFREPTDWVMLGLTAAACVVLGRRTTTAILPMLLIATAVFAFRARRDLWFVVLADLLILGSAGPREVPERDRFTPGPLGRVAILSGLALLVVALAWLRDLSPARLEEAVARRFPVEAARFVAEEDYAGPLFNDFNYGGYLMWALPTMPVAIDGRTNLHGDARIERYGAVWSGLPGWEKDADLSTAGVIIAEKDQALVSLLRLDKRFRQVHEDDVAVVFVRKSRVKHKE
jgi:hypothetical protein